MRSPLFFTLIQRARIAALCVGAAALPSHAAALDTAATAYFASGAFRQLLVEAVAPAPACPGAADIHLEKLLPVEDVVMGRNPHPETGGWTVQFELQACGRTQRHNLSFRARHGERPDVARLPRGDTRMTPPLYRELSDALRLGECNRDATVTAALYSARGPATIVGKPYAAAWQEQWTVNGCGDAPRTIDLCIADAPLCDRAWMAGRCGG